MHEYLDVSSNTPDKPSNVILLDLHGDKGEGGFYEKYARRLAAVANTKDLRDLIHLEADKGAPELTKEITNIIRKYSNLVVQTINVLIPRALIDLNRANAELAVWPSWDHTKDTELLAEFQRIYAEVVAEIRSHISKMSDGGIILGVHTMAPFGVADDQKVILGPENLRAWIDSYINAQDLRFKRQTDIITGAGRKEQAAELYQKLGRQVVHPDLQSIVLGKFDAAGIPCVADDPYHDNGKLITTALLDILKDKGLSLMQIDFLKTILVEIGEQFNLLHPKIDPAQINKVAQPIAAAIIEYFEQT